VTVLRPGTKPCAASCEHLIWDRAENKIYSNEFVKITTDDEIIMGEGFESNEQFTKYRILKPKGTITKEDE
jgi:hypothetical protein